MEAKRRQDNLRRQVTELQEMVRTDRLTGLYNRRLPSSDEDAALMLAQRLRREIARSAVGNADGTVRLTVSVGCAAAHDPDGAALIGAADAALHRAKAGGRNRVSL